MTTMISTAALGGLALALAAAPVIGGGDTGIAPPATIDCRAFAELGAAAKAGGKTWNAAAVQRLFYDAYAMGLIDGSSPGTTLSLREGILMLMPADRRFQAVLASVDNNLEGFCRWGQDKKLDGAMLAVAVLLLEAADRARSR